MQTFDFKTTRFSIFSSKFGDISALEAGVIIAGIFSPFSFWKVQIIALPFFMLIFSLSKFNNTITKIVADEEKQIFLIFIDTFFNKKEHKINFNELSINVRYKWLLNFYKNVIEIKNGDKIIAVMPVSGPKYKKTEKKHLINLFRDLASEKLIKYSETEKAKNSLKL